MKQLTRFLIPVTFFCTPLVAQQHDHSDHNHLQGSGNTAFVTDNDSLAGFNADSILFRAHQANLSAHETQIYLERSKKVYIAKKYKLENPYRMDRVNSSILRSAAVTACTNTGFESGDFTGWTGAIGDNTTSSTGPLSAITPGFVQTAVNAPITDCTTRHTIMQAPNAWYDVCGGFPVIPPNGGQYVVRLGNNCANFMGQYIEQTFTVDPSNTNLTYRYAVVLNDGGHGPTEQPYFRIEVLDAAGAPVSNCLQYYVAASSSADGFLLCPSDLNTFYKGWTTVTYDLLNYLGQDITLRFTSAGCIYGGHYGYAYVEASCSNINDAISATFCSSSTGAVLAASSGFSGYQWFDPNGNPIPNSNNDSIYVNNVQNGDTFSVEMEAITDSTCLTRLKVVVEIADPITTVTSTDPSCAGGADGSATANCVNCIPPVQYIWSPGGQTTSTINNLVAGTYVVEYEDSIGCTARDTIRLSQPGQTDPNGIVTSFCFGDQQVTLTATAGQPGYQWYTGGQPIAGATSQTLVITNPVVGTTYEVEYATSPCPYRDLIVLNYSPPQNLFSPDSLVNIFTPNGDGQNDFFYPYYDVSVARQTGGATQPAFDFSELYIGTYEIRIFNRWGREVFYSNDYNVGWDGRMNGSESATGVYYWVAKYTTRCNENAEVQTQNGFVHLIR